MTPLRTDLTDAAQSQLIDPPRVAPALFERIDEPGDEAVRRLAGKAAIRAGFAARGADGVVNEDGHAALHTAGGR